MLLKMALRSLTGSLGLALLLFLPAGSLQWPGGWAFIILLQGCGLATGLWLLRTNPALLAERMASPFSAEQRLRDRAIIAATLLACAAWIVAMGLDRRFDGPQAPAWGMVAGALLIFASFLGFAWVLRVNSFAAITVRVQAARGQTVISTGPYAVVRHPMYAFGLLLMLGTPLLLGSLRGLAGIALLLPLLGARTLGEEALLMAELPGYAAYAARVRYRLVPGLW
jgi:protein-S-isoprenylcysteine O-methyltransferase Ste14